VDGGEKLTITNTPFRDHHPTCCTARVEWRAWDRSERIAVPSDKMLFVVKTFPFGAIVAPHRAFDSASLANLERSPFLLHTLHFEEPWRHPF